MPDNQLWVAEYSPSQKFYNVSTLNEALNANRHSAVTNTPRDYIILAMFETSDKCFDYIYWLLDTYPGIPLWGEYANS